MIKKLLLLSFLILQIVVSAQNKKRIDSLSNFVNTTNIDTSKVRAYGFLCWEYISIDSIQSFQFGEKGLDLSIKINFKPGRAQCLFNLGSLYEEHFDYLTAISYFKKAKIIREQTKEKSRVGSCLRETGVCYTKLSKYDIALKNYFDAIKYFEEAKNKSGIYNTDCAIAEVFYLDGNFNQSIIHLEDALTISLEMKDSLYIANAYMNLGLLYGENKEYKKALEDFQKSREINEVLQRQESLEALYLNMGLVFAKLNNNKDAIAYYEKCLELATQFDDKEDRAIVLSNLSQIYIKEGDYAKSIYYGEQSLELSQSLQLKDKVKDAAENLAEANGKLGNFEKAFSYQQLNSEMKDSLYNEDRQSTIAEMQTKYEVDKKEKENLLLNQKVDLQTLDAKQQKIITYSMSSFVVLIDLLAFFIFISYRQKKFANQFLEYQNREITMQKEIIEVKNKDITDSINYARRIQTAILPSLSEIQQYLPETFILYKPKDIVSGDFYWFTNSGNSLFIAVADCTGHGVPGAFMSMIGNDLLTQVIVEKGISQPNLILSQLHDGVRNALKQDDSASKTKDGMDIALIKITPSGSQTKLEYSGALRPLWIIHTGTREITEYKPDKFSIGGSYSSEQRNYTNHAISIQKADTIYLTSDGYSDQFGGEKGKKFKNKKMHELLIENSSKEMDQQKEILEKTNVEWKGNLEQVDDILVIGVRI